MKQFAMLTVLSSLAIPLASHAANPQQVNNCVNQMTDKNMTDRSSAQKVCSCIIDEQSKITQAQKNELDQWVKSGKDVRQNHTFQTISNKLKACGSGIKFNQPRNR